MKSKNRSFGFGYFFALMATLAACLGAPPGVLRTNAPLTWTLPTNFPPSTNFVLKIYSSTNIAAPLTNWTLTATVVGTNTSVNIPINAQQRFFVCTLSNWWGESDFSNVLGTQPIPTDNGVLQFGP